ncbi:MAG: ABC transporter ATP-binding protein [Candidatus Kapaibacteriales bacterium]
MIQAKGIKKSYLKDKRTRAKVLLGIDLNIQEGEFLALMGPSGVGKTTLLYVLSTIDTPDEGEIIYNINGKESKVNFLSSFELSLIRNKYFGFVFQFHHLLPEFTALENVAMPRLIAGNDKKLAFQWAKQILDWVEMSHRLEHKPAELSGGEQQRVAIARAIVNNPKILFADEPTGNLDSQSAKNILDLLQKLKREMKLTLLIATHSKDVAYNAEQVIHLKDGLIESRETVG